MLEDNDNVLAELLSGAVTPALFAAGRSDKKAAGSTPHRPRQSTMTDAAPGSPLADGIAVVEFLLAEGGLDLSEYVAWNRLGIAFKNTYGENGFAPWLAFSEAADGFESEDDCRKAWDLIKPRAEGEKLTIATYVAKAKDLGWKPTKGGPTTAGKVKLDGGGGSDGGPGKGEDHAAYTVGLVEGVGDEGQGPSVKPH